MGKRFRENNIGIKNCCILFHGITLMEKEREYMKRLFHNGMVLFLSLCLLVCAQPCADMQAAGKNKKAGSAFAKAIATGKIPYKKGDAAIVDDLDKDGVKELIVFINQDVTYDFEVWKYSKGTVSKFVSFCYYDPAYVYYDKDKKLFWYFGECEGSWLDGYQVVGKKVKQKVKYSYSIMEKGKYPVEKERNGKKTKITMKKYKKLLRSVQGIQNENAINPVSKSKLIKKLAGMK